MISETRAVEIAEQFIAKICASVEGGVAIIRERTIQKSYGWIFFYNAKRYLETGDPLEALGGNGPLVVERDHGRTHALNSAQTSDVAILEFERIHGLG